MTIFITVRQQRGKGSEKGRGQEIAGAFGLGCISNIMHSIRDKVTKMLFSNNNSVLKEYKGSYGLYTRFE